MKLTMVTPTETEVIWQGEIAELPLTIVQDNMPYEDETGEEGYEHVGNPVAIHAALIADGNETVAGWGDNEDACWFEWRPDSYLSDGDDE